jgi:uncharacterized protein (TIGR04255 family)
MPEVEFPVFPNPPITEAILEISYAAQPDEIAERFDADFWPLIREAYPFREERKPMAAFAAPIYPPYIMPRAALYRSSDGLQVVQARADAFALSRLPPYQGWGPFRDAASVLWQAFSQVLPQETRILSVAARYLNRLSIPFSQPLSEFVNLYPEIPDKLPVTLRGFFLRVDTTIGDRPGTLTVQEGILASDDPETASLLLDIDLRFERDASVPLWQQIDELRPEKNNIFNACISDRMRAMLLANTHN